MLKLPSTLTQLTTGYQFNQQVDKLPPTLIQHTKLGNDIYESDSEDESED
jgi:hypothetical protein